MQFLRKSHNLTCSHIIFLCLFVCMCSQKKMGFSWGKRTPSVLRGSVVWHNCWLRYCREKGLNLLTVSPSQTSPFCTFVLKIALDLHVRFLFGLKSWTNYALQIHRLDKRARFPFRHVSWRVCVASLLSTSYECRGCPGVVVECKTFLAHLRKTEDNL